MKIWESLGYESAETKKKKELIKLKIELQNSKAWLDNVKTGLESHTGGTANHMQASENKEVPFESDSSIITKIEKHIENTENKIAELEK